MMIFLYSLSNCILHLISESKNNGGSKRYSRKREPSVPKTDSFPGPRRTNSQKSKNFDKRPPQRGGGRQYGATGGGRREEVGIIKGSPPFMFFKKNFYNVKKTFQEQE